MVALDQAVTHARLRHDGHPALPQRRQVAVNSANADLEMRRDVLRPHHPPALQVQQYRHEPLHPIHGPKPSTGPGPGGLFFVPSLSLFETQRQSALPVVPPGCLKETSRRSTVALGWLCPFAAGVPSTQAQHRGRPGNDSPCRKVVHNCHPLSSFYFVVVLSSLYLRSGWTRTGWGWL